MTVVQGLPYLLQGLGPTLLLFLGGAVGALGLAFAAGLLLRSPDPVLRGAARSYVGLFRGWPVLILLFWLYFVFPPMLGIAWGAYPIGIGALALNGGAYGEEIVRGALAAVPRGQGDAARALGLTRGQVLRCILLPQAFVAMLPPLGNLMVELLPPVSVAQDADASRHVSRHRGVWPFLSNRGTGRGAPDSYPRVARTRNGGAGRACCVRASRALLDA